MAQHDPKISRSQRLRLGLFRALAALLLLFAILGVVSLAVGAYFVATDPSSTGWFPSLLLGGFALMMAMLVRVSYRALRVRSVEELEEQSKSKWLSFDDSSSPNRSLERGRDG